MTKAEELEQHLNGGLSQEELDSFKTAPVETMNRRERRSRLKYFSKMLEDHMKNKPKVNINEEDPEKQQKQIFKMQAWATRYGILKRKVTELDGPKRNS